MSNVIKNRQQRRAAQAQARRAKKATIGSEKIDPETRTKARKAVQIIKRECPTLISTRSNLYQQCMDGVTVFEVLRRRDIPNSDDRFHYRSLLGQQLAPLFAEATLDNVLTVLIEETADRKWSWHVVLDNGLVFGSREIDPSASRKEAEESALAGLGVIGSSAEPTPDYTPEVAPEEKLQIRVNGKAYVVRRIFDDPKFSYFLTETMEFEGTTYEGLLARLANFVLVDGVKNHPAALMVLANCGWAAVTQEILEDFCAANGVDDLWASSDSQNDEARHTIRPPVH